MDAMKVKITYVSIVATITLIATMPLETHAQQLAVKTNLLYAATTTPNIGLEARLAEQWTAGINFGLNPFTFSDNKKLKHLMVVPQARYWLCESFFGSFVGFNAAYIHYNVSNINFPLGLYPGVDNQRRQGDAVAAGASWGRAWLLSPRWSIEVEAGLDLGYTWFKAYDHQQCGTLRGKDDELFLMPRLALSFAYHGKFKKRKDCRKVVYEPMPVVIDTIPAPPPFVPFIAMVPDNTGKAGLLEQDNPVLQHISQYRPYDNTRILRKEKGALYVHFPLGKSELLHDYRSNAATLDRIVSITRQILADSTSSVKLIQIVGLASPEGVITLNNRLAGNRAEALKQYITRHVAAPDSIFELCNGGEAWTELRDQINDSHFEGREAMLDIIDHEPNADRREQRLKRLDGGRPYKYLRDNMLSDQRNSGYLRIYYDYVPDEAARVINTASELLQKEQWQEALDMLLTVSDDPRSANALGVAYYMTGRKAEAMEQFRRAAADGNEQAKRNLEQMEK